MSERTGLPPLDPADDVPSESRRNLLRMMGALGLGSVVAPGVLAGLDASTHAARAAVQPGAPVEPLQFWIPNWPT